MDFAQYKYVNKLSKRSRLRRLAWGLAWAVLCRWTPGWCLNAWRAVVLRAFGAKVGRGCRVDPTCTIWAPWNLAMGDYVCLAPRVDCYTVSPIRLGSKVTVSQRAFLCTASHDISSPTRPLIHAPITVGDHAWVCAEAFVGPGVKVGEGAVTAARAVVIRDVQPWTVVGGNPAKLIKHRQMGT